MTRTAIASAFAFALAAPALAGTTFTANLETPTSERMEFVANKAIWVCEGETCVADLNRRNPTVRSCRAVAKEAGRLASFSSERGELEQADLDKCNESAKS